MIAEAIQKLTDLINKSNEVNLVPIPGVTDEIILQQGNSYEMIALPPPHRRHQVDTLDSFKLAGERWTLATVWIGIDAVIGVLDDDRREDVLICPMTMTQQFATVVGLADRTFDVHGMTRLIRRSLAGTGAETLLPILSRVEWANSSKTIAERQHGKESMGRSVENQVNALDEIPETITLYVPVFDQMPDRSPIRCVITIDSQNHTFALEPILDERTAALDHALGLVNEMLATFDNVYFGKPAGQIPA